MITDFNANQDLQVTCALTIINIYTNSSKIRRTWKLIFHIE